MNKEKTEDFEKRLKILKEKISESVKSESKVHDISFREIKPTFDDRSFKDK
jgi:hypothetical protein